MVIFPMFKNNLDFTATTCTKFKKSSLKSMVFHDNLLGVIWREKPQHSVSRLPRHLPMRVISTDLQGKMCTRGERITIRPEIINQQQRSFFIFSFLHRWRYCVQSTVTGLSYYCGVEQSSSSPGSYHGGRWGRAIPRYSGRIV